jgi:hypothetical protein
MGILASQGPQKITGHELSIEKLIGHSVKDVDLIAFLFEYS